VRRDLRNFEGDGLPGPAAEGHPQRHHQIGRLNSWFQIVVSGTFMSIVVIIGQS